MRVLFSLCVCACVYLLFHQKPMTSSTFIVRPLFFLRVCTLNIIFYFCLVFTHTHTQTPGDICFVVASLYLDFLFWVGIFMYFVGFEHLGFEKITFSLSLSRGNTTILYIIYIYTIQNYMVQKKSCLLFPLYSVECINTKSRIWRPLWWETAD